MGFVRDGSLLHSDLSLVSEGNLIWSDCWLEVEHFVSFR